MYSCRVVWSCDFCSVYWPPPQKKREILTCHLSPIYHPQKSVSFHLSSSPLLPWGSGGSLLLYPIDCRLHCGVMSLKVFFVFQEQAWMMDNGILSPYQPRGISWAWWWMVRWFLLLLPWAPNTLIQGEHIILEVSEKVGPKRHIIVNNVSVRWSGFS